MTGAVVWLTGLPASGKSTLAHRVIDRLRAAGTPALLLDGDELRAALVPAPGHDAAGRDGFYRTLANLACVVAAQGLVVVVAATAHRRAWRALARARAPRFVEVHVATPVEECRRRDPKGLYADPRARPQLPGAGIVYEPPEAPEVTAPAGDDPAVVDVILDALAPRA